MPIDVQGDGSLGTSGAVINVKSRDTILVKADGSVVDAATISATDAVYLIDFEFTLPKTSWQTQVIQVSAADHAAVIQTIAAHDHVTAAWYAPDTNAAGVLIDTLVVVVASTSGNSDTQVEIPFSTFAGTGPYDRIAAANVQLDKIEAIT
jgi:hypothetical protein